MSDPMTYEQFELDWMKRHRGSAVKRVRVSSWGLIVGLLLWGIIAIGAALVSGAHSVPAIFATIPALVPSPFRELLSLSGFSIFELLIFAGSMYRRDSRYAGWGLLISVAGALAANIGSSIQAVAENGGDLLSLIVALVLAFIAPLAAFLAGEMVHHLYAQHARMIESANAITDQKRRDLDATINAQYARYLKGLSTPSNVSVLSAQTDSRQTMPALSSTQTDSRQTGFGYSRASDGQSKVIAHLTANPDDAKLTLRVLGERAGVNKDTAAKGLKIWLQSPERSRMENQPALLQPITMSSNGHSTGEGIE